METLENRNEILNRIKSIITKYGEFDNSNIGAPYDIICKYKENYYNVLGYNYEDIYVEGFDIRGEFLEESSIKYEDILDINTLFEILSYCEEWEAINYSF